jgi:hypothetical protein
MTEIKNCRICSSTDLTQVLTLGNQALTGVFPCSPTQNVSSGSLDLVWCRNCGLLQMKQSYNLSEMYGMNYGYRSGLNSSMVDHLTTKIQMLEKLVDIQPDDMVLDIGSNDATSLKAYTIPRHKLGIDPTGIKFKEYYTEDINLIADFFTAEKYNEMFSGFYPKIITSIAMFYDLEKPSDFVKDIAKVIADDGIWHLEQSYMPSMLRSNAYDTVCHEHLEFYSFKVIKDLIDACGMRVIDVQMNTINGGSFAVTACKDDAPYKSNFPIINWMLRQEARMKLNTPYPYRIFEDKVYQHRNDLVDLLESLVNDGKTIFGYGASTKGNVLLQFCGIDTKLIKCIADVNKDKFGCYTPGTHIPIISEEEAKMMKPDYFLVFPWHFKHNILEREKEWIKTGGKFIFPLPEIEIV